MKRAIIISACLAGSATLGASIVTMASAQDQDPKVQFTRDQGHHGHMGPRLEDVDANNDGQITMEEVKARDTAHFAEVDTNNDGFITTDEMSAFHEKKREEMRKMMEAKRHQKMLETLDTDEDGKISAAEFSARPHKGFSMADKNGDGVVDAEEIEAVKDRKGHHKGKGYGGKHGKYRQ